MRRLSTRFNALSRIVVLAAVLVGCNLAKADSTPPSATPSASGPVTAASPASGGVATTSASTPAQSPVAAGAPQVTTSDLRSAVRIVAQNVKPAVVQITNEQFQLDQFNQPFTVPAGVGSGVIYDQEGHVLTNYHVIAGAQRLQVALPDGRSFRGNVIGTDSQTDLAVLQITGQGLRRDY